MPSKNSTDWIDKDKRKQHNANAQSSQHTNVKIHKILNIPNSPLSLSPLKFSFIFTAIKPGFFQYLVTVVIFVKERVSVHSKWLNYLIF